MRSTPDRLFSISNVKTALIALWVAVAAFATKANPLCKGGGSREKLFREGEQRGMRECQQCKRRRASSRLDIWQ